MGKFPGKLEWNRVRGDNGLLIRSFTSDFTGVDIEKSKEN